MAAYIAAGIFNEGTTALLYYMNSVYRDFAGAQCALICRKEGCGTRHDRRPKIAGEHARGKNGSQTASNWIIRSCLDSGGFIIWTWNRWLDVSWKKKCLLCVKCFWNFKGVFLKTMFLKSVSKISRKRLNRLGSNFYTSFINIFFSNWSKDFALR